MGSYSSALIQDVSSELGTRLTTLGFLRAGRSANFRRRYALGFHEISLNIAKFSDGIHCAVHAGVRVEAMERLRLEERDDLPEDMKPTICAFGCELGNLHLGARKVWEILYPADGATAAAEMVQLIEVAGLPFFERFDSLERILELAAHDGPRSPKVSSFPGDQAEAAICLAFLLDDRARFQALVETKRTYLKENQEFALKDFEALAARLERRWSEDPGRRTRR